MKMNLRMRMVVSFLIVAVIAGVGFGVVITNLSRILIGAEEIESKHFQNYEKISSLALNVERQVSLYRMYALTADPRIADQFAQLAKENEKIEQDLIDNTLTEQGSSLTRNIRELNMQYSDTVLSIAMPMIQKGDLPSAHKLMLEKASPVVKELTEKIIESSKINKNNLENQLKNSVEDATSGRNLSVGVLVIVFILCISIGMLTARNISMPIHQLMVTMQAIANGNLASKSNVKRDDEIGILADEINLMMDHLRKLISNIQKTAEQVAASSEELTSSADQSAKVTTQIATSIMEVSVAAEKQVQEVNTTTVVIGEISKNIQEADDKSTLSAKQAGCAAATAKDGRQYIDHAVQQMGTIEMSVGESAGLVGKLGERSKEIGQIVDTIAGIAGQTNLLALNAAIEAARAGEQGRGFAVVAEEVRKLAEQSQNATKQIAGLIGEIQADTNKAVTAMGIGTQEVKKGTQVVSNAGQAFTDIVGLIEQVSSQVTGISETIQTISGSTQQIVASAQGLNEDSKMVSDESQSVSAATEQQSAAMEEIAAASQSLSKLAQGLQTQAGKFHL